ncbi:hypothetical protein BDN72DRAFT_60129 [Pluteus cervinus]|uniref:Uncharacterized protein n=1 Tax=Pluteus cervinus TaxID=181527 RepID=A0ACD3AS69_9AGAR|nr:hypothetical protein BDN72DRAFT_60129 [Pluteus cervinus]
MHLVRLVARTLSALNLAIVARAHTTRSVPRGPIQRPFIDSLPPQCALWWHNEQQSASAMLVVLLCHHCDPQCLINPPTSPPSPHNLDLVLCLTAPSSAK